MAERVTEIADVPDSGLRDPGVHMPDARYLGKVSVGTEETSMVQLIEIEQLLSDDVRELLFSGAQVNR